MVMKNKIDSFIKRLGITPYRFAKDTGLSMNNIYLLKNDPSQFPSARVFDLILERYKDQGIGVNDIVEWVPIIAIATSQKRGGRNGRR
ncbi:hypothetical protein MiYa_02417 [Microcystis aeruginosa NIES-2519]|uniref:HTH cro/C1-type domain-containing protein n=2 Tax=Microcystaceae TaxID=1890449 RepID=A0A5A5RCI8_MICAE|nr:XRE family transcriptional regulator [Microcystis sp. MC19]GCA70882.1 hypothetical protein MiYa_02417 [Microcystis aeruginosa NIES-2519]CCI30362.1 hypothetical protein MICAI_1060048 [Microcystis sp. T1-4]